MQEDMQTKISQKRGKKKRYGKYIIYLSQMVVGDIRVHLTV